MLGLRILFHLHACVLEISLECGSDPFLEVHYLRSLIWSVMNGDGYLIARSSRN